MMYVEERLTSLRLVFPLVVKTDCVLVQKTDCGVPSPKAFQNEFYQDQQEAREQDD